MIRCRLGLHDFPWPPHTLFSWQVWIEVYIECARGCGARTVRHCHPDEHWSERHPEP